MMRLSLSFPFLALFVWTSGPSQALEIRGAKFDDKMTIDGKSLVLNGVGVREATVFNVSVYAAALYLPHKTKDPKEVLKAEPPKAVEMEFLRSVDREKIVDGWKEELTQHCDPHCKELDPQFKNFYKLIDDMKNKDRMSFIIKKDKTEIRVRGKDKGEMPGEKFAQVLMEIWFGGKPPNPALQKGMLGRK